MTEYHVKNNRHHPEFHWDGPIGISATSRDESDFAIDAFKMSRIDVAEMICDWWSVAAERGGTPRAWFEKCSGTRWNFHPEQIEFIDQILKIFEKE